MANISLLEQIISDVAKNEGKYDLNSQFGPPSGGAFHDALVRATGTVGQLLGTALGSRFGGARAAAAALYPVGNVVGAWTGHGAYIWGLLVKDILSHPENWTVDAAGAIVPAVRRPEGPSRQGPVDGDSAPGVASSRASVLNPASTDNRIPMPFGTGGQFAPGSASSSRPLYETRSFVPPSDAPTDAGDRKNFRQLVRVTPKADLGGYDPNAATAPSNELPSPDRAPSFADRFGNWVGSSAATAPLGSDQPLAPPAAAATGDEPWSLQKLGRPVWAR